MIFAPSIPLSFDDQYGYENVQDLKELVKFHLTNLLLTNPGEKISDPEYGVGIRQFLFENQSKQVFQKIKSRITTQIRTKLSYVKLSGVLVQNLENYDNLLNIKIYYSVEGANLQDVLNLNINLNTGIALFSDTLY